MAGWPLLLSATIALLASALYAAAGFVYARRANRDGSVALGAFSLFWFGVAVYGAADSLWALLLANGPLPLAFAVAVLHLKVLGGVAGFGGLVFYLLYIYTGRRGLLPWVAAGYLFIFAVVTFYYVWRDPLGQAVRTWGASIEYGRESSAFWYAVVALLFVPPLAATGAYALLLRVVSGAHARLRVATVSIALSVFFAGLLLGWLTGAWYWWGLVEKLLALATIAAVLWTQRTPGEVPASGPAPTA